MASRRKRAGARPETGSAARASRTTRRGSGVPADHEQRLRALARERTRVGLSLTAAVFVISFGFIGAVAYARESLGALVVPGLSVGILAGALVIVASWLLTWVYVRWANDRYDPALRALRER